MATIKLGTNFHLISSHPTFDSSSSLRGVKRKNTSFSDFWSCGVWRAIYTVCSPSLVIGASGYTWVHNSCISAHIYLGSSSQLHFWGFPPQTLVHPGCRLRLIFTHCCLLLGKSNTDCEQVTSTCFSPLHFIALARPQNNLGNYPSPPRLAVFNIDHAPHTSYNL